MIYLASCSLHPPFLASLPGLSCTPEACAGIPNTCTHNRQIECTQVLMCTIGWLNGCFLGALVSIQMGPMFTLSLTLSVSPANICRVYVDRCTTTRGSHDGFVCMMHHDASIMRSCNNSRPICRLGQQSGSGRVGACSLVWHVRFDIQGRKHDYYGLRW